MARNETVEAVVLKAYDVGEADRFCILLTKERGRIAARARGARKLGSKMGGSLLPFQYVQAVLHNGSHGCTIVSVHTLHAAERNDLDAFYEKQQSAELLLHLLHDEEPLPDVFALTKDLAVLNDVKQGLFVAFSIRLLHHLGMLPLHTEGTLNEALRSDERAYMEAALSERWHAVPETSAKGKTRLRRLCERIVNNHSHGMLTSTKVIREALTVA